MKPQEADSTDRSLSVPQPVDNPEENYEYSSSESESDSDSSSYSSDSESSSSESESETESESESYVSDRSYQEESECDSVTPYQKLPVQSLDDVDLHTKTRNYSITADSMRRWQRQHWARRTKLDVIDEHVYEDYLTKSNDDSLKKFLEALETPLYTPKRSKSDMSLTDNPDEPLNESSLDFLPPLSSLPPDLDIEEDFAQDIKTADSFNLRQQLRQQAKQEETFDITNQMSASDDQKLRYQKISNPEMVSVNEDLSMIITSAPVVHTKMTINNVLVPKPKPAEPTSSTEEDDDEFASVKDELEAAVEREFQAQNMNVASHEYSYVTPMEARNTMGSSVTAIASSRAMIKKSNESNQFIESQPVKQAYVTTQATGAKAHIAVARAAAKAASIASATVNRDSVGDLEEYRIFISTSCTIKPSYPSTNAPLIDSKKLQVTINADQKFPTQRSISSPRRLDHSEANENIFSLLRLGRKETTEETITQEIPSPTKEQPRDYTDLEMTTKSILKNSTRQPEMVTDYAKRISKTVENELTRFETSTTRKESKELGQTRSREERFSEIRKQLDALKARQAARQAHENYFESLSVATSPKKSQTLPTRHISSFSPNRPRTPPHNLQVAYTDVVGVMTDIDNPFKPSPISPEPMMAESAYISDSSPSTGPNSPPEEKASRPFNYKSSKEEYDHNSSLKAKQEISKEQYKSVLQESFGKMYPTRTSMPSINSLPSDEERIRKARDEYFSKRVVLDDLLKSKPNSRKGPAKKLIEKAQKSKATTLDKNQSKSLHTLKELMDDDEAVQTFSTFSAARKRFKSTDLDDVLSNVSRSSSTYNLNAYDIRPGQIKSLSLFDIKGSALRDQLLSPNSGNVFSPDSKSYASLIETDIDTGDEVLHSVDETDIDEIFVDQESDNKMRTRSMFNLNAKKPRAESSVDYAKSEKMEYGNGLNRAASEDFLNDGKSNKKTEKRFIDRLQDRAHSERELDVCKSLSRLDIPQWLDNMEFSNEPYEPYEDVSRDSSLSRQRRYSSRKISQASDGSDYWNEQSYKPLIIATRVTVPTKSSLRSPKFSPLGTTGAVFSEPTKKLFELSSERYKEQKQQEPKQKYYTPDRCSVRNLKQEDLNKFAEEKAAMKDSAKVINKIITAPIEMLKLTPSDFMPKNVVEYEKKQSIKTVTRESTVKTTIQQLEKPRQNNERAEPRKVTGPATDNEIAKVSKMSTKHHSIESNSTSDSYYQSNGHESSKKPQRNETHKASTKALTPSGEQTSLTPPHSRQTEKLSHSEPTRKVKSIVNKKENKDEDEEKITIKSSVVYTKIKKTFSNSQNISDLSTNAENDSLHGDNVHNRKKGLFELGLHSWQSDEQVLAYEEGYAISQEEASRHPLLSFVSGRLAQLSQKDAEMAAATEEARRHFAILTLSSEARNANASGDSAKLTIKVMDDNEMSGRKSPEVTLDEVMQALSAAAATASPNDSTRTSASDRNDIVYNSFNFNTISALTHSQDACSPSSDKSFFPNQGIYSLTEIQCGVIKEGSKYLVECMSPRCAKRRDLFEAKKTYRSCHNCFTYYCSRTCRAQHWEAHKKVCIFSRLNSACKHVIKAVLENETSIYHLSRIARTGYLCMGRGCILLVFENIESSHEFAKDGITGLAKSPIFVSIKEMTNYGLFAEQMKDIISVCKNYDPETHFVINVAVSGAGQLMSVPMPRHEGPMIKKWACVNLSAQHIRLSSSSSAASSNSTVILTSLTNNNKLQEEERKKERQLFFTSVQRTLRQRGVILRHHFSDLYDKLLDYVETGDNFPPQTIYPIDSNSGRKFMCCIMPNSEPIIQWVSDPTTFQQLDLSLETPKRPRTVMSTDL